MKHSKASSIVSQTEEKTVAEVVKKPTKQTVLKRIRSRNGYPIDFGNSWYDGVEDSLSGKHRNQSLEISLMLKAIAAYGIKCYPPGNDEAFDDTDLQAFVNAKLNKKPKAPKLWTSFEPVHRQAFNAVLDRGESRKYPDSLFALMLKLGYVFK